MGILVDSLSIINKLAQTASRIDKEQIILSAFMEGNREFFIAARLAYDPLITFGVAKVASVEDDGTVGDYSFADFLALADKLYHRQLTGHAARDAIIDAALRCDAKVWNGFYRRILLKDLKAGVEDKTINKILTRINGEARDFLIPIFGCQLAHDGAKEEHAKKIRGTKMLDIKLDGVRLLSILDKEPNEVTQFTRNGKQNDNFDEIRGALSRVMAELPGSVMLDAEVTSKSFQQLMTQVNRRSEVDTSETRLALFDIVPLSDFRTGMCTITQENRHEMLASLAPMIQRVTNGLVYVVPKVIVDLNTPEGQETFTQFNRDAIAAGYEGIMVKEPNAPYELKRSHAWLKIKPFIEVSLAVVGFEEGKADGKYKGTLGAIIFKGEDDGDQIEVNVGSGLSDELRKVIWENQDSYMGLIGEVRADAKTLERGGTVYSLRFPRFKAFRGFSPGEKI